MEIASVVNVLGTLLGIIVIGLTGDALLDDFFDESYKSKGEASSDGKKNGL